MAEAKLNRRERIVLGTYFVGAMMLGTFMTTSTGLRVIDRTVTPDFIASLVAVIVGLATIAASIVLSVRFFGSKAGWRLIGREAWPGLLYGAILGVLCGFAIGAVLPGFARLVGLAILLAAGISVMLWFANQAETL